ncbi:hypothetical protein [Neisseria sp. CCUG12390]|uniref:hypothetical protein n=1 Tax=Neisseria sp. CCUG12390 TaxID=3392035 RepID=UPI003A100FF9
MHYCANPSPSRLAAGTGLQAIEGSVLKKGRLKNLFSDGLFTGRQEICTIAQIHPPSLLAGRG